MLRIFCSSWIILFIFVGHVRSKDISVTPGTNFPEFCSSGFCFTINKTNKTFSAAEAQCRVSGRSLLTVSNAAEQKFLLITLQQVVGQSTRLWFGLHSVFDRYQWVSGSQVVANTYFASPPAADSGNCFTVHADTSIHTWAPERCDERLWFLCGNYSEAKVTATDSNKRALGCPPQYHLLDGACFLPKVNSEDRLTWSEAARACRNLTNGSLATISSLIQQDFLSMTLASSSFPAWIGLQLVDGEHHWNNQANITFTNWIKRQPTGGAQNKCSMAHQQKQRLGEWEDVDCNIKLGYICQAPPTASPTQASQGFLLAQGRCRKDFIEFEGRCYRFDSRLTSQTEDAPAKLGQELCPLRVSPRSPGELALMRLLVNAQTGASVDPIWIGVNFTYNVSDAAKVKLLAEDHLPVWGSSLLDFAKLPTILLSQHIVEKSTLPFFCVALSRNSSDFAWMNCSASLPSMCGYQLADYEYLTPSLVTSCPTGWLRLGNQCYSPVNTTIDTWAGAEATCQSLHNESHLASLRNSTDQQFVGELLSGARGWLGLRVQTRSDANSSLRFQWSDGSPIDFLPIKLDELSERGSGDSEQCVVLRDETHDWDHVSCYDRHVFICQLTLSNQAPPPAAAASSVKTTADSNMECSDTGLFPQMCIELRTTPRVFWKAQDECRAMGKTLVTIPSKDHQRFVMDYLRKRAGGKPINAFVGLFSSAGRWRWVSDYHSLPSTFWSANHPEQENQCVFADTTTEGLNTWKSGPCEVSLPFLCGTALQAPEPAGIDFTKNTCPPNFLQIGSSCFSIHAEPQNKTTWNNAAERCKASGATLATISSLHEQDGLAALLALQPQSAWIGFRLEDGHHSWVRGGPVVFTNWGKGQPAGRGTRCTFMNSHFAALGDWGDEECDTLMGYICHVDPVPLKSAKIIPELDGLFNRGHCADGYYEYRNQCFAIYDERNPRSTTDLHDNVSGQCLRMVHVTGSNCGTSPTLWGTAACPVVATPHTYADAAFLRVLLSRFSFHAKNAWVGLKVRRGNGTLQPTSEDGSLLGASALIAFEPASMTSGDRLDSRDSRYDCVVASTLDTQLKVVDCEKPKLPAICAYFLDDHVLHQKNRMISAEKCPLNWSFFGGKCYAMMPAHERKDWNDAEKTCNAFTKLAHSTSDVPFVGHLVSVHSLEEQHHLFDLAGNASLWLGLYPFYELSSEQPASIHTNRSVHLAWTDESPVDYVAFARDPGSFGIDQMRCFIIDGDKSQWHPIECFQKRNFICQLSYPVGLDDPVSTVPFSIPADDIGKCDQTFPLISKSNKGCYRILRSPSNWVNAESACRSLSAGAHLASVHNHEELNELIDVISRELKEKVNVWVGLYESDLAYQWSDGSAVQFIPLSADQSKDARHLSQDCFVLSPNNDRNSKSPYSLRAVDCSSSQPVSVCKSPSTNSTTLRIDDPSQWKLMLCPPGYRQYADRCFSILSESTTWAEGNQKCSEQARQFNGYSGSLARIDSTLVQEFVASLLDDLPPKISSAWIGLQQNISSDNSTSIWSDGSQGQFLRSIYRESVQGIFGSSTQLQMCTALYRSTYPRLNGLWLQWSCDKPILLASVCQASPPSVRKEERKLVSYNCPVGFFEGTTGFSLGGQRISQPVCYRLLSTNEKFGWKASSDRCKQLSTPGHNVSLLSVASVFEASFLRSWLRLPRAMGGAGLPADEPVWSGLQVTNSCPDCYKNWTWDTLDNAPVRFTDWLIPPSPTPSGCYLFHPNPYTRRESLTESGLGSLQLAGSCDLTYFAVCQTLVNESVEKQDSSAPVAPVNHQAVRPKCFTFDAHSSDTLFLTNVSQSHSGRPCIRWDLIPQNLTEFRLGSNWLRHRLHITEVVGGDGFASYAENYCSVLYLVSLKDYKYECYVGLNPPTIEECDLVPCPHVLRRFYLLGPATTAFIVIVLVIAVAILAVGLWRGYAPLRSGYRRYFSPMRFTSNRMQRSSVQFVPPDTVSCIQTSHINNGTNGYFGVIHNSSTKATPENITSSDHSRLLQNQSTPTNGVSNGQAYIYTPPAAKPEIAQTGFINPIYAPHNFLVPEDDYDPEADI